MQFSQLAPGELWSASQSAAADRHTMDRLGMSSPVLMERASLCVSRIVEEQLQHGDQEIRVLCGPGNNGGDGLAVARQLHGRGLRVRAHLVVEPRNAAVAEQLAWAESHGVQVERGLGEHPGAACLVVDAILGTGAQGAPRGGVLDGVRWIHDGDRVVAIDAPTGLDIDSGRVHDHAVLAACTVTFQRSKPGLHVTPGRDHAGIVVVADIGLMSPADAADAAEVSLIDPLSVAQMLSDSRPSRHKGDRGHVGLIAGGAGTPGAAVLAASAALRAGAGLATVATNDRAIERMIVESRPELMAALRSAGPIAGDVLVVGPGLLDAGARSGLSQLYVDDTRAAVWDASALEEIGPGSTCGPRVLTPHPGEAARLMSRLHGGEPWTATRVQEHRMHVARELAAGFSSVVVLKGAGTVVADSAGRVAIDVMATAVLATAGTGDVLAGIIGALLARGCSAWQAARAGVCLHAYAGRNATSRGAPLAGDVVEGIADIDPTADLADWPRVLRG